MRDRFDSSLDMCDALSPVTNVVGHGWSGWYTRLCGRMLAVGRDGLKEKPGRGESDGVLRQKVVEVRL